MRRVVYLLLGLSLIVLLPAVVAAQTMTAKEAAELVKERITVPADAEDFTSDYSEYDGRGQWEFRWKGKGETLSATLDAASGDIVNLYAYGDAFEGKATLVPKVSEKEALEAAKRFLQKAAPSRYNSLRFTDQPPRVIPLSHQQDYSFYFERIVNGVPCSFNGAEVRVSQSTGKITNYYLTWDYKSKFPPAGNTISPERGAEIMKDNAFELMYFRPYPEKEGQEREVKLVYGIYEPRRVMVDAVSGKFVKSSYFYLLRDAMAAEGGMGGMDSMEKRAKALTPIEEEEIAAVANLLSKEEVQESVFKHFELPEGFKLSSARLYENDRKERVWHLSWNLESDDKVSGYMSAAVNAQNGEVLSYSKHIYDPDEGEKPNKYSVSEAKKIAEDFLRGIQPQKMNQVRYFDSQDYVEGSRSIRFRYTRLVNGVPFYEDGFEAEVDRATGEVTSFSVQWGSFNFPKANPGISLDKAYEKLTEANSLDMAYLRVSQPRSDRAEQEIGLYYFFEDYQPRLVDAMSGKVLMDSGEEYVKEDKVEFTDIAGHPAESDIKLLYSLGVVGDATGKFNPNAPAVNSDFIKMLVLASGWSAGEGRELENVPDAWYIPYYQTAVYRGILSADNLPEPGAVVTRMDCARYLIAALKLDKAAELEGIFLVPAEDAADIPVKDAGYAAIALKMGLLSSINGKFEPGSSLTRGEAASVLVRYMQKVER